MTGPQALLRAGIAAGMTLVQVHRSDAAGQAGQEPVVRLVRSLSGTRGTVQGSRYVIEDPRSVFSATDDRQVVVLFEWEAPPGLHRCEGRWKDPSGKVVLTAPLDYQSASRRFSLYWALALPETAATGLWALEASVDGALAGTHTFEIRSSAVPTAPGRALLPPAEMYKRAMSAVATLERIGPAGEVLGHGPAVALDADNLVAAFSSIDGASSLRLRTTQGTTAESREIGEWNRSQGWAVVKFPAHGLSAPPRRTGPLAVGTSCQALDSTEDGTWVISETGIVGQEASPGGRPRLNSIFAAGSPVFDGYGDLAGIVASPSADEGLGPVAMSRIAALHGAAYVPRGMAVVPADRLPTAPTARVSLAELAASGQFLRPLSPEQRHVISGVFAGRVQRGGAVPMPYDQGFVFSRRNGHVSVFIQWNPQAKKDGFCRFDLYDADLRLLLKGDPNKVKLRPGELFFSTWTVGIGPLAAGVYRVDMLLDDAPIWRGYVRITD